MGARRGGQGGHLPPLEFEKMTSYAAVLQNTLKFSLAPTALAIDTLYFSLKRAKKCKIFRLRLWRVEKMVDFLYGAPKTCQLFKMSVVLPPLWKNFCGRPWPLLVNCVICNSLSVFIGICVQNSIGKYYVYSCSFS